jgi:hypothetical protein
MAKAMYRRGVQIVKGIDVAMKDMPRTAQEKETQKSETKLH